VSCGAPPPARSARDRTECGTALYVSMDILIVYVDVASLSRLNVRCQVKPNLRSGQSLTGNQRMDWRVGRTRSAQIRYKTRHGELLHSVYQDTVMYCDGDKFPPSSYTTKRKTSDGMSPSTESRTPPDDDLEMPSHPIYTGSLYTFRLVAYICASEYRVR